MTIDIVNEFAVRVEKAMQDRTKSSLLIGEIVKEARAKLSKKEFPRFLKDARVNLKPTQARKNIRFFDYVKEKVNDELTEEVLSNLGIEKIDKLAQVESISQQDDLERLLLIDNSISISKLSKVVKQLNENKDLMADEAWDIVKNLPKQKRVTLSSDDFVSKEEYEELKSSYEDVVKQLEEAEEKIRALKEENIKLNNNLWGYPDNEPPMVASPINIA